MAFVRVNPNLEAEVTGHTLGTHAETHGPLERVLGGIADDVAQRAKLIARREYYQFGGYTRGIHGESGMDEHGRLVGRCVATDWKSHWAEKPPRTERGGRRGHILARAAQQVGLEVTIGALFGGGGGGGGGGRAITARRSRAISGRQRALTGR